MKNKKIIIDTSAWIEYFKNNGKYVSLIEDNLNMENVLITGIIVSELLHGVRGSKEYDLLSKSIGAVPYIECIYNDWLKTGKILYELKRKGMSLPLTDVLIAVIAIRNSASILTLDRHFKKITLVTDLNLCDDVSFG
jgi:predicted nucleic acid-binding protein